VQVLAQHSVNRLQQCIYKTVAKSREAKAPEEVAVAELLVGALRLVQVLAQHCINSLQQ
jgi:hypothetical protein